MANNNNMHAVKYKIVFSWCQQFYVSFKIVYGATVSNTATNFKSAYFVNCIGLNVYLILCLVYFYKKIIMLHVHQCCIAELLKHIIWAKSN